MTELKELVDQWLALDKNPETRKQIQDLWAARDDAELERRLRNRIEFGTAGLRGKMEAGFGRMNDLIIIQASQGLSRYVLQNVASSQERGVVIGHDHRHNSERWAQLTAAAFLREGFKVYLHRGLVHTPLVPFSVSTLKAACGVMITASHNPKEDNGYKVYWENAVQIIGPHDEGIAAEILQNLLPHEWNVSAISSSSRCVDVTATMRDAYFANLTTLSVSSSTNHLCPIKFVNTSMHGVGHTFAVQAFENFNFPPFTAVPEQRDPDPEFPSVKFPNPEEKGALDLAMRTAETEGATYVLAQDPDADRFSAAQRLADGQWRSFSGDQIGALLAAWTLQTYHASRKPIDKLAMVASTVSSKMIESMARREGFRFVESLTGFKYIGNTALDLQGTGYNVVFGYEEAIGFMLGSTIRDKDGISATVSFAEMVTSLHSRGVSASQYLDELYERYGYYETSNSYFVCRDPPTIDRIFARLRAYGPPSQDNMRPYPTTIAGLPITRVRDLTAGHDFDSSNSPTFKPDLPLSGGHMVTFRAGNEGSSNIVLTIRTSGTEPKIKYYLEGSGPDRVEVGSLLQRVVKELATDWMQAETNGLVHA